MQDANAQIQPYNEVTDKQKNYLLIIYIAYAIGLFTGSLGTIIGLVMAYIKRDEYDGTIYDGHTTYLIRTFWISLLYGVICIPLIFFGIGTVLLILVSIWFIVRVVKGFVLFYDGKPIAKPKTWWI
jgi:uncharacterized membrane protein